MPTNVSIERCANCGYYFPDASSDYQVFDWELYPQDKGSCYPRIKRVWYTCEECGYSEEV